MNSLELEANFFQDFHIPMIPTTAKKFVKNP